MARANNKYTSINFNNILLQNDPPSSSSSTSSASYSSVARSNGRMLVLKRPSPKPLISPSSAPATTTTPHVSPAPRTPDQTISNPDPNQISLRPLGHTGPGSSLSFPARIKESVKEEVASPTPISVSHKPDRFVPPHLRPGYVRKDEKPGIDTSRARDHNLNLNPNQRLPNQEQHRQGNFGYGQIRRPRSGGYERIRPDPRSNGNRPGTSGWYVKHSRNHEFIPRVGENDVCFHQLFAGLLVIDLSH